MDNENSYPQRHSPLAGARIWLSGSIPEDGASTPAERESIIKFVRNFSRFVYQRGGYLLHGSHPDFIPILLDTADEYQREGGGKDCLTLAVSRYFLKNHKSTDLDQLQRKCMIFETPEASGEHAEKETPVSESTSFRNPPHSFIGETLLRSYAHAPDQLAGLGHFGFHRGGQFRR